MLKYNISCVFLSDLEKRNIDFLGHECNLLVDTYLVNLKLLSH